MDPMSFFRCDVLSFKSSSLSSFYLAPLPALSLFTTTGAEEEGASSADEGISLGYSDGKDGTADFSVEMEMESDGEAGVASTAADGMLPGGADFSVEMESDGEADDISATASARAGLRTSKRSTKYSGSMEEVSVNRFAKRPNGAGHKYHPPRADKQTAWTQRQRNKKRSRRCYAERSRAVAAAKLAVCDVARKKLDVALENFRRAKKGWGDAVSADPSRLNLVFRENALLKRVQVVRAYIGHMIETRWSQRQLKQKAVAKEYFVSPKLVAMWTSDFLRAENTTAAGSFRPLNFSPINPYTAPAHSKPHVNDERVRSQCHWFVRTSAIGKGCPNLKAEGFQKWVNSVLIPKLIPDHKPICPNTANNWLHDLGFRVTSHKKTMYIDGHEREDVVKARGEFVVKIMKYAEFMSTYGKSSLLTVYKLNVSARNSQAPNLYTYFVLVKYSSSTFLNEPTCLLHRR